MQRVLIFYYDAYYTKRHNGQEATPCSLLLPQLGVASDGDLTEVAYGVAQPTKEGQTMHSLPVTSGNISVAVETILKGFEDFSVPVPMPEWSIEKLSDALGSFITWPYAWVRFTNMVIIICTLFSFIFKISCLH